MIIGLLKENQKENRVSLLPEAVSALVKKKVEVWVEGDAGKQAFAYNKDYEAVGATIKTKDDIFKGADVLLRINPPDAGELDLISEKQAFLGVGETIDKTSESPNVRVVCLPSAKVEL